MTAQHLPTHNLPLTERIYVARQRFRWSQAELAKRLNEVSGRDTYNQSEISRWESGKRPQLIDVVNLAEALKLPLSYFGEDFVDEWTRLLTRWEAMQQVGGYVALFSQPVPALAA